MLDLSALPVTNQEDLFSPVVPQEKMHRYFRFIRNDSRHAPAREIMRELYQHLPNPDGNFIKDFQTTGFDRRVWELYLFAALSDIGFDVQRPYDRPDYLIKNSNGREAWIEAVTANPTEGAGVEPSSIAERQEYLAIKFGSPLYSKLNARYWELNHVKGLPLIFAIADFHEQDIWREADNVLMSYLYGVRSRVISAQGERVRYELDQITEHSYGEKTIPSN